MYQLLTTPPRHPELVNPPRRPKTTDEELSDAETVIDLVNSPNSICSSIEICDLTELNNFSNINITSTETRKIDNLVRKACHPYLTYEPEVITLD